jgi:transposase
VLNMTKTFRPYSLDQQLLLPPDLRGWLPEGDLALFVSDVVDELDLSAIHAAYESGEGRGQTASSRKIEQATYRDVAFRVLAGDQHPDHDSIAEFRKRHLGALAELFVQGLRLCQAAGLVKLGHVALDGTKLKANASKHKAMSYARMAETERRLEAEVRALLEQAQQVDAAEDAQYGPGRRGDELPAELARRASRLTKIRAAKAALEQEAKAQAAHEAEAARAKLAAREHRVGSAKGKPAQVPDPDQARPAPTAQRNFTDPESRIMVDGATKEFVQGYNAQAAVDSQAQVIVACGVTQAAADVGQFVPMLDQVAAHLGHLPAQVTADAGYFSEANLTAPQFAAIDFYVPPDRHPHGRDAAAGRSRRGPFSAAMRTKLQTAAGRAVYARRKTIPEPVFGQIKQGRGFRRFWLRGVGKVRGEWGLICLTHNLLKLFRARTCPAPA